MVYHGLYYMTKHSYPSKRVTLSILLSRDSPWPLSLLTHAQATSSYELIVMGQIEWMAHRC